MIPTTPRYAAVAALLLAAAPVAAQEAASPGEIVEQAPHAAWRAIAVENLLVGTLASGGRVVIQLAPQFSPLHTANVRALASIGWWDGSPVNRVQGNFVVQWGGAAVPKSPPTGMATTLPPEYEAASAAPVVRIAEVRDAWSANGGFLDGWPVTERDGRVAPAHCYATVGAGREAPPDTGWGSELYVVIGQAPRQLDRNMAVVGRVIEGMEYLAGLPRGTAPGGELAADQPPARWKSLIRADRLPESERPAFEYLDTASPSFARYAAARATFRNPFYLATPGVTELCSLRVPIRPRKQ